VIASHPKKAKKSRIAARPTESQPCGMNGVRAAVVARGTAATVAATSTIATAAESASFHTPTGIFLQ
jgi:hypothetical protein